MVLTFLAWSEVLPVSGSPAPSLLTLPPPLPLFLASSPKQTPSGPLPGTVSHSAPRPLRTPVPMPPFACTTGSHTASKQSPPRMACIPLRGRPMVAALPLSAPIPVKSPSSTSPPPNGPVPSRPFAPGTSTGPPQATASSSLPVYLGRLTSFWLSIPIPGQPSKSQISPVSIGPSFPLGIGSASAQAIPHSPSATSALMTFSPGR